jgi:hypothetical protein
LTARTLGDCTTARFTCALLYPVFSSVNKLSDAASLTKVPYLPVDTFTICSTFITCKKRSFNLFIKHNKLVTKREPIHVWRSTIASDTRTFLTVATTSMMS